MDRKCNNLDILRASRNQNVARFALIPFGKYRKWIGHYEFGENFEPVNVGGWLDDVTVPSDVDEEFWLSYWNAAYTNALDHKTDQIQDEFEKMLCRCLESFKRHPC